MIPGFGKQALTIGSDPRSDIVVTGPGVAPEHARIVRDAQKLVFVNGTAAPSSAGGRQLGPGEQAPFDFRTQFHVGQNAVPLEHPAIILSMMSVGQQPAVPGKLVIGRDAAQASLVIGHPSVSGLHCTVALDRMMITDHDSTSGTYVGGQRIPPSQPTPVVPGGIVHLGPVPVQLALLERVAMEMTGGAARQGAAPPAPAVAGPAPAGAGAAAAARKHKTVFGQLDFSSGESAVKTIGRTASNDIVIAHPQVSAHHAQVELTAGKLFVLDRGSANGTYVRGQRIGPGQRVEIQSGEKIYVGPMPLQLQMGAGGSVEVMHEAAGYAEAKWAGRPLYEIEAWSLYLEVPDRDDRTRMKVLLDTVSFKALPGDMIALMGPSGAGKTTLLLALNGYLPPTQGLVRINGEDLYSIYDTLRGSIGYVPQDDLVHPELTVFEAVRYSAKFRLPPDYSDDEIDQRVMQTLRDLGLEAVAHLQIGAPEKKILSGGQRKRVNIALELVTDPVILYLDEPTSGLAADDAAGLIHLLHDLVKATGKTIIMTIHQPAKDEYEKFSHALILGYGGVPMFFGPTRPDSYEFFGRPARQRGESPVDNPRDMFALITERERAVHDELRRQDPNAQRAAARQGAAMQWRAEFFSEQNAVYKKMFSGARAVGTGEGRRGIPERRPTTSGQFRLLLSRYFKTKVRDVSGTVIMLAQAPIIGVLLAIVFGWQEPETPAWCLGALNQLGKRTGERAPSNVFENLATTQDHTGAIFFLVVSAIWFGTSNAAREIVRERSIYLRERMVNLGLFNYVMSKFALLALFCVVQCAMLLSIVFFALKFNGGLTAFAQQLAALIATSICAVALGLLLSTAVASSEAAMALTPIALIPQVVLGGLMVPATTIGALGNIMYGIPARWGFEATIVAERQAIGEEAAWLIELGNPEKNAAQFFITGGKFQCAVAQMASEDLTGAWAFTTHEDRWMPFAVLAAMTVGMLIVLCLLLKRRDPV
jgi:ABC-type multidrug transport system ATPase subunit/pSer/pThr/pTyr-binding forkhead associated (FHA) protein